MWMTAFLDWPADTFDRGVSFWRAVTGGELSAPRGGHGEFASLEPAGCDAYVKVQRLDSGPARVHVDVHVPDLATARDQAVSLGAEVLGEPGDGYVALRSPGGVVHCVNDQPRSGVAEPVDWGAHRSRVHSVVLDVPGAGFEADLGYWPALTGTELKRFEGFDDYRALAGLDDSPLRVLLQRTGPGSVPGAHLDVASSDRAAEVRRHVQLGAVVAQPNEYWTVMRDPTGLAYCITDDH